MVVTIQAAWQKTSQQTNPQPVSAVLAIQMEQLKNTNRVARLTTALIRVPAGGCDDAELNHISFLVPLAGTKHAVPVMQMIRN